jgi:hypothetical protein
MESLSKKKKYIFFSILFLAIGIFIASAAFAQTQITISTSVPGTYPATAGTGGPGAFVANFYNFALMIGGVLAFGVIVYGGVKYMASAGNPSGQSDAKEWIEGALLGLLLLVGAYFILSVVNPQLLNLNLPSLTPVNIASIVVPGNPVGSTNGPSSSGSSSAKCQSLAATGSGTVSAQIDAAAVSYCGASSASGPGNGKVSCAWAVNNVLTNAGIANIDSTSVQSMENALTAGRGTLVSPAQAMPGDIVIQAQDGHVGICMNVGCTQVLSNSSSNASFTWVSNTSFSPSYSGGPGRIYQVNH